MKRRPTHAPPPPTHPPSTPPGAPPHHEPFTPVPCRRGLFFRGVVERDVERGRVQKNQRRRYAGAVYLLVERWEIVTTVLGEHGGLPDHKELAIAGGDVRFAKCVRRDLDRSAGRSVGKNANC